MPLILPLKSLKDTSGFSELCQNAGEPVFVTKNGYGDMVIMSMEIYKKNILMKDVYSKLDIVGQGVAGGQTKNARKSLELLRKKHGV